MHILSTCYVKDTVLGTENIQESKGDIQEKYTGE